MGIVNALFHDNDFPRLPHFLETILTQKPCAVILVATGRLACIKWPKYAGYPSRTDKILVSN